MERLARAVSLAERVHRGQLRKGTTIPYLAHVIETMAVALRHGASEDEACAACLHDTVEDAKPEVGGKAVIAEIETTFGPKVSSIVAGCSDSMLAKGETEKEEWDVRKRRYLDHLPEASRSVLLVSCADKLSNASAIVRDLKTPTKNWPRSSPSDCPAHSR